MTPMVFLDFDGVLFDTAREAFAVALLTHDVCQNVSDIVFDDKYYDTFFSLRYLVKSASDYSFLIPAILDDKEPMEIREMFYSENKSIITDGFEDKFFSVRSSLRSSNFEEWIGLNKEFPFFDKIRSTMSEYKDSFSILTTKDENTVKHLLKSAEFSVPVNVYGAEKLKKFKEKNEVILHIYKKHNIQSSIFVDDNMEHLRLCENIPNITLLQPIWGYIAPEDKGDKCDFIVNYIDSFLAGN